ncbi:endothelin-converting enzyme homolog [Gordionus sp. m RMFG-2023]|uniref:endothelin-converting enzyme homolog n=1 Tax=Gordionus sp. m RMFG-2023 TaxID=3053472 RepID=UPI0031FD32B8
MNQNMDPCTDFYEFACGGYMQKTTIPTGYPKWDHAMQIADSIYSTIKDLLGNIKKGKKDEKNPYTKYEGMAERQAKIYYDSCLDKTNIRKKLQGKPLKDLLDLYGGWDLLNVNKKSSPFIDASSTLKKIRYPDKGFPNKLNSVFFSLDIHIDPKNSSRNLLYIFTGDLPNKDHYDNSDHYNSTLKYMTKIGNLLRKKRNVFKYLKMHDKNIKFNQHAINKSGHTQRQKKRKKQKRSQLREAMANVLELEELIEKITPPLAIDDANYQSLKELDKNFDFMNWTSFVNQIFEPLNISISADQLFWVTSISYMKGLTSLIKQYLNEPNSSRILHDYIMWHKIRPLTSYLSKKFSDDPNVKNNTIPNWKLCLKEFPTFMNYPISSLYLKSNFYSKDKLKLKGMVDMIKLAYKRSLQDLNWMDITTKARSIAKVDAMKFKIGYPDYIINPNELDKDYRGLYIEKNSYFKNYLNQDIASHINKLKTLFEPIDKERYHLPPHSVEAYYSWSENDITFLAGLLQKPFYDSTYPDTYLFGAIGSLISHEISHGFDNIGREYDEKGNLNQWWTNESIKIYVEKINCYREQYSNYSINKHQKVQLYCIIWCVSLVEKEFVD